MSRFRRERRAATRAMKKAAWQAWKKRHDEKRLLKAIGYAAPRDCFPAWLMRQLQDSTEIVDFEWSANP